MVVVPFILNAMHAKTAEAVGFPAVYMTGAGAERGFPDVGHCQLNWSVLYSREMQLDHSTPWEIRKKPMVRLRRFLLKGVIRCGAVVFLGKAKGFLTFDVRALLSNSTKPTPGPTRGFTGSGGEGFGLYCRLRSETELTSPFNGIRSAGLR
jgi:hypothetical protein